MTETERKVQLIVEEVERRTFGRAFELTVVDDGRSVPLREFQDEIADAGMEIRAAGPRAPGRRALATADLIVGPRREKD